MKPVLVKIDVAVADTGRSVRALFEMADGRSKLNKALDWVFDFSNPDGHQRRELRFWRPELEVRGSGDPKRSEQYHGCDLETVIRFILPETRPSYRACDVSELFQIRHNTRARLLGGGGKAGCRTVYSRRTLARFLRARWLGWKQVQPSNGVAARTSRSADIRRGPLRPAAGRRPGALRQPGGCPEADARPGRTKFAGQTPAQPPA